MTHNDIITEFGLQAPALCYDSTLEGLWAYLGALTIGETDEFFNEPSGREWVSRQLHLTAEELATPYHPEVAKKVYGTPHLIPGSSEIGEGNPDTDFPKIGALIALVLPFRKDDGRSINWVNWYRPSKYNADPKVAGAKNSDHLRATAVDLGFKDADHRNAFVDYLEPLWKRGDLRMSLGFYRTRIHVGLLDEGTKPGQQRAWGPTEPRWAK